MKREDAIALCRYYKGESENPHQTGVKALLWGWERDWVELTIAGQKDEFGESSTVLTDMIQHYVRAGLAEFENLDGVPVALKALLLDRFEHWNESSGFEEWYRHDYLNKKEGR